MAKDLPQRGDETGDQQSSNKVEKANQMTSESAGEDEVADWIWRKQRRKI